MARSEDPTRTKTIRRTYGQRLRGTFGRINAAIREAIVEDDILGLSKSLTADVTKPSDLSTLPPDQRIEEFESWLETAMESEVLEVIARDDNRFVRQAYERGVTDADTNLRKAGVEVGDDRLDIQMGGDEAAAAAIRQPTHERALQVLFSRNYSELNGITSEVARQVTRELADGLSEGVNPREMARRIDDRVDKVGKTRATVLARTETINAHTQATVERYREQGVESVGIEPEVQVQTAGDQDVCEQCADVAQRGPWELDEFEGSAEQPPIHPQCRCAVIPVVETD